MPIREYECKSCKTIYEVYERKLIQVKPSEKCPECGKIGKRVFSVPGRPVIR